MFRPLLGPNLIMTNNYVGLLYVGVHAIGSVTVFGTNTAKMKLCASYQRNAPCKLITPFSVYLQFTGSIPLVCNAHFRYCCEDSVT